MIISLNALQIYTGGEEISFDWDFDAGIEFRVYEPELIRVGYFRSCGGGERDGAVEGGKMGFGRIRKRSGYAVIERREGSPSSAHSLRGRGSSSKGYCFCFVLGFFSLTSFPFALFFYYS